MFPHLYLFFCLFVSLLNSILIQNIKEEFSFTYLYLAFFESGRSSNMWQCFGRHKWSTFVSTIPSLGNVRPAAPWGLMLPAMHLNGAYEHFVSCLIWYAGWNAAKMLLFRKQIAKNPFLYFYWLELVKFAYNVACGSKKVSISEVYELHTATRWFQKHFFNDLILYMFLPRKTCLFIQRGQE